MKNITVFIYGDNYGVIGNPAAPVNLHYASNIHNSNIAQGDGVLSTGKPLSDFENELLRLFSELGIVEQSKVIVYADELTNNRRINNELNHNQQYTAPNKGV